MPCPIRKSRVPGHGGKTWGYIRDIGVDFTAIGKFFVGTCKHHKERN